MFINKHIHGVRNYSYVCIMMSREYCSERELFGMCLRMHCDNAVVLSPRTINIIGQITQHVESQKHGAYLHLFINFSQLCHVVYHVQPIVMVYTPQNMLYAPCY